MFHDFLIRGDTQHSQYSWYYQNGLSQELAFATFGDKERTAKHICNTNGCHSCRLMLGPGGEEGPHSGHAKPYMRCQQAAMT